jgi:lysophospholipase L1-like esterase
MHKKQILFLGLGVLIVVIMGSILLHVSHDKTAVPNAPKDTYIALGDSVAAGYGLETNSDPSACGRTDESYPHLVAETLHLQLTSFACSGASLDGGIVNAQEVNKKVLEPQLTQLFRQSPQPRLITLTSGANDIHWIDYLKKCYVSSCGSNTDSQAIEASIADYGVRLQVALAQLEAQYDNTPTPRVIVTGYYGIFPSNIQTCSTQTGLTAQTINWWNEQENQLNNTIEKVVKTFNFARYAAIDFSGHDICSQDSWVQDIQTKGAFHPNDAGQRSISKAVITLSNQ